MNRKKTWFLLGMIWVLISAQGAWLNALAQTKEPILRLDVGTHNAGVWGLALDPSNRILVTSSEDKTVRVWDISGQRGTPASSPAPCRRRRGGTHFCRGPVTGRKDCGVWGANRLT